MELDVQNGREEHFEVDPVYEHIAAPKYWDFGRISEDGTVDRWFEDPNTAIVESPVAYHEPKQLLGLGSSQKNARSVSGSPLRLRQKAGHPLSPGRAQRRPAIAPSPLRKSVLSLNAMAAAAVFGSPLKPNPAAPPQPTEESVEPSFPSSPPKSVSPPLPETDSSDSPEIDTQDDPTPTKLETASEVPIDQLAKGSVKARPPLPASAANAFAEALGATLCTSSQPLFMRRNKKPLEPLQTGTGGARRVVGRDLPSPANSADVTTAAPLQPNVSPPLERSSLMQENLGVRGQQEAPQRPPPGPKPGHVRLRSSRGRSLNDHSWRGAVGTLPGRDAGAAKNGQNSEDRVEAMPQSRDAAEDTKQSAGNRSNVSKGAKKGSLEEARRSGGGVRSSLGVVDENAKERVEKQGPGVAPTAVGRLKGRKSETMTLVRASSPRVEKVRAAWKLRRSVNLEMRVGGKEAREVGGVSKSVTALLEARLNNLTLKDQKRVMHEKGPETADVEKEAEDQHSSPGKVEEGEVPPPSSMEKAGQLLRRMGAAVGALLTSVSPLEKQKPSEGESKPEAEAGRAVRVLQFEDKARGAASKQGGWRGGFLVPANDPKSSTGADPEVPEVSPGDEEGRRKGGVVKRQSLLQRLGGASRKLRERSHTPRGRAKKDGSRKKLTPGTKAGNISRSRPLAVRLTLKEKERRLAVARRMAKLEEDNRKHAITMGWLRSSAAPLAALRPAPPPAPPKITQPHPFPLRTEERGAAKQREWKQAVEHQLREEEAARNPHAHPLPRSLDVPQVPPKPVVKHPTVPAPFDLDSVKRHEAVRARMEADLQKEAERHRQEAGAKARPPSNHGPPPGATRAEVEAFALRTDQRAADRREFDQLMANKIAAAHREKELQEQRQKDQQEAEVAALRRSLVVRAQPMPFFDKPFKPRKSTKGLTVPHSPKFSIMSYQKEHKQAPPPPWEELFGDRGRS